MHDTTLRYVEKRITFLQFSVILPHLARFPFHTEQSYKYRHTTDSSKDHPPFFARSRHWRASRMKTERRQDSQSLSSSLFLSGKRTIPEPRLYSFHSFLDCICSLLDIPFYWTKPRSLPSWRPFLHPFALLQLHTRIYSSSVFFFALSKPSLVPYFPFDAKRAAPRPRHHFIPRLEFQTLLFTLPRAPPANLRSFS